jgi:hypothetical protein
LRPLGSYEIVRAISFHAAQISLYAGLLLESITYADDSVIK